MVERVQRYVPFHSMGLWNRKAWKWKFSFFYWKFIIGIHISYCLLIITRYQEKKHFLTNLYNSFQSSLSFLLMVISCMWQKLDHIQCTLIKFWQGLDVQNWIWSVPEWGQINLTGPQSMKGNANMAWLVMIILVMLEWMQTRLFRAWLDLFICVNMRIESKHLWLDLQMVRD